MLYRSPINRVAFLVAIVCLCGASAHAAPALISGADFSFLSYFESQGVVYKENGRVTDGLKILKDHGVNCVRLRIFTSSAAQAQSDPYNYINNLSYNLPLALRVKNAGLAFLLDFHYSDTWADPGHQAMPSAWTNLNLPQLALAMRAYNSNTIAAFAAEGAMPDYVQVGNEITSGMLWPLGYVSGSYNTSWSQLGQLMKAAVQGIQDAVTASGGVMPKIIVHIDRGGDWSATQWFFDNLNYQGVPYDIIGESYYPFFQGPLSGLRDCLTNTAKYFDKPVLVAETAFPWNNTVRSWTNQLDGFPPTTNGQVSFIAAVAQVDRGLPGNLGAGICYWGSEYQAVNSVNEAGYNTASFFDAAGNVLPVADAIGSLSAPFTLSADLTGPQLALRWPLSEAGWNLVTSPRLTPPTWTPVANTPINTGLVFSITIPAPAKSNSFYRLRSN